MLPTMHERILILDYGSQVTQLIARRVRDTGVYCEIHPGDVDRDFIRSQRGVKGVILSGSHASAYQDDSLKVPTEVFEMGVRSEEPTSDLQSLMRISYAVFCLDKKKTI